MKIKKLDKTSETRQGGSTIIWQHYEVLPDPHWRGA